MNMTKTVTKLSLELLDSIQMIYYWHECYSNITAKASINYSENMRK